MKKIFFTILITIIVMVGIINKDKIANFLGYQTTSQTKQQSELQKKAKLEQIEQDTLRNIKTKEIINKEIHKTQKITVLEGKSTYKNTIPKQAWLPCLNNNLNVTMDYNFQVQYNVLDIHILDANNGIATICIDTAKDKFQTIIALQPETIKQNTDRGWYAVGFDSTDLQRILAVAQEDVEKNISNNNEIYKQAVDGLKEYIEGVGEKTGVEIKIVE